MHVRRQRVPLNSRSPPHEAIHRHLRHRRRPHRPRSRPHASRRRLRRQHQREPHDRARHGVRDAAAGRPATGTRSRKLETELQKLGEASGITHPAAAHRVSAAAPRHASPTRSTSSASTSPASSAQPRRVLLVARHRHRRALDPQLQRGAHRCADVLGLHGRQRADAASTSRRCAKSSWTSATT